MNSKGDVSENIEREKLKKGIVDVCNEQVISDIPKGCSTNNKKIRKYVVLRGTQDIFSRA